MYFHVHLITHFLLSQMDDANASIPSVQSAYGRPMWGSLVAGSATRTSYDFVSKHAFDKNIAALYGLSKNTAFTWSLRLVENAPLIHDFNDCLSSVLTLLDSCVAPTVVSILPHELSTAAEVNSGL